MLTIVFVGSTAAAVLACGTFMKHLAKPFEQPDAPDCTQFQQLKPMGKAGTCYIK